MTKIQRASGRYRRAEVKSEAANAGLRAGLQGQLLAAAFKLLIAKITAAQGVTTASYKAYLAKRPAPAPKALQCTQACSIEFDGRLRLARV